MDFNSAKFLSLCNHCHYYVRTSVYSCCTVSYFGIITEFETWRREGEMNLGSTWHALHLQKYLPKGRTRLEKLPADDR